MGRARSLKWIDFPESNGNEIPEDGQTPAAGIRFLGLRCGTGEDRIEGRGEIATRRPIFTAL